MFRFVSIFLLFFATLISNQLYASGGGGPKFAEGVNYIDIKPPLIVNYGGAGSMRYIKAEISLRTESMTDALEITHHLPLIRDKLISIFSQVTEESIASAEGKEKLRLFALQEVNNVIHQVEKAAEPDAEEESSKKSKSKSDKKEKSDKKKGKKDKKDKKKDKKSKDKKKKSDEEKSEKHADKEESGGPASDLFFNNFVVQK